MGISLRLIRIYGGCLRERGEIMGKEGKKLPKEKIWGARLGVG